MITKDVKFNGKDYKIRNNYKAKMLYQKELKINEDMSDVESFAAFAWCILRGFNLSFDMSFDEFSMYIDDPDNEGFIKGCTEVLSSDKEDNKEEKEPTTEEKK